MNTTIEESKPIMRRIKVGATAAVASIALIGGTAALAAAGTGLLAPGQSTDFGTNTWGETRICVYNYGPQYGQVVFSAFGSGPETDWIPPHDTYCKSAWWWGFNVNLANSGSTYLYPYNA